MTNKVVLAINDGHPATACLLKNGEVLSCISEERLDRIKNSVNFPVLSIKKMMEIHNIRPEDIDLIAFTSKDIDPADLNKIGKRSRDTRLSLLAFSWCTRYLPTTLVEGPLTKIGSKARGLLKLKRLMIEYKKKLDSLGLKNKEVVLYDHHMVHAATAYYFNNENRRKKFLIFTCDGEGDGLCASVNIAQNNTIIREVEIPFIHSIGKMYNEVTWFMGLKPWEHEYKVMGMAPYSNAHHAKKTWAVFKNMIEIDKRDKRKFRNKTHRWAHTYGLYLRKRLYKHRFDAIAFSIQKLTEDILKQWVSNNIDYYGIHNIMLSGGVFLNVKANQAIMEMDSVNSLFVVPSAGDESTALGGAILGYLDLCKRDGTKPKLKPIKQLYLGPSYDDEIDSFVKTLNKEKFKIEKYDEIEKVVGELLTKGKIVARLKGRMEFGARALGNRSILADPTNLDVIRKLNFQIKARDFWMPFAPTILRERARDYLKLCNKEIDDQYMILSFDTTKDGRKDLKAAIHQQDFSCRPQVLDKDWNEKYYSIIKTFEESTGVGGILNTSFNLHGEPIVCSPEDAISTLKRSGLKYLALGNYLIEKNLSS